MTSFAVNSGVQNYDSFAGASNNATLDTWTVSNGAQLLINTDSYQCANHSVAAGSLDNVAFSGVGGSVKIDGTSVRVIPFASGSGTVPAIGTGVTQGAVSGYFLGVWANWQSEPLAAGAAMPSSGFIKIKNKTGGNFSAALLSGISATATGADVVGWIEIRGADTGTLTIPRIGTFEVAGDWFELGTTNGSRGQVLQCPTTATVAGVFPAIQIETSAGSGVYEWYVSMGTMSATANTPTDSTRGKLFWQTTSGIVIGSDGTNNVGYLPASGCKVRIPNVILTCCTRSVSGSGARVTPNDTLVTRQEFNTQSAGKIILNKCVMQWYGNFNKTYLLDCDYLAFCDDLLITTHATPFSLNNCAGGITLTRASISLTITNHFVGGEVIDSFFCRTTSASSSHAVFANASNNITFTRTKIELLSARTFNSYRSFYGTFCSGILLDECIVIAGQVLLGGCIKCTVKNLAYCDTFFGLTTGAGGAPQRGISFQSGSSDCKVSGYALPIAGSYPYLALVETIQSSGTVVENIGTSSTALDIGSSGNASNYCLESNGGNVGVKMRRCYVSNTRTAPHAFTNSDFNVSVENCFGDYADVTVAKYSNGYSRGCGFTSSTAAESSVYGTHWRDTFLSATTGEIRLFGNEPTTESSAQVSIVSGSPIFTSQGNVLLPGAGDQIIFEMPYFALGHTAFANSAPSITSATNLTVEFQVNTGSGYGGTWQTLNATNLVAVGAINPAVGVKLKIRVTATASSATTSLTQIAIATVTTSTAQKNNLYPLDMVTLTLTGLPVGCDIFILQAGTTNIITAVDSWASSSFSYAYDTPQSVDIGFVKPGYVPYYIRNYSLQSSNVTLPISLTPDRNYL